MNEQDPIHSWAVEARYSREGLPTEYIGNPLIEALPGILPHTDVIRALMVKPAFDEGERLFSSETRIHLIGRLFWQFFQPLEQHIRIWDYLSICIRQGYIRRNPLDLTSAERANELYAAAMEGREPAIPGYHIPNAVGFAIIGVSGVGKSTAVESMLRKYPQVIQHHSYKGKPLEMKQIVWLKMDCSHNGSERGFCLDFLSKVDQLVGTSYYPAHQKRATADTLLTLMSRVADSYSLGILLVDEIQHLANSKQDRQKLLNFFVTLENTIGVPVVLLGTPGALPLLQKDFRAARRCCAHGDVFWNPLKWEKNIENSEWEMFLKKMWRYQWIREPAAFSYEFVSAMYEETQGIEALAVILFILLQENAIRGAGDGHTETITVKDVSETARRHMNIVQPMLDALRSGDQKKIAKYSDIISEYVSGKKAEHSEVTMEDSDRAGKASKQGILEGICSYLTQMGIKPETAMQYARKVMECNGRQNLMILVREALGLYWKEHPAGEGAETVNAAKERPGKDLRDCGSYDDMEDMEETR